MMFVLLCTQCGGITVISRHHSRHHPSELHRTGRFYLFCRDLTAVGPRPDHHHLKVKGTTFREFPAGKCAIMKVHLSLILSTDWHFPMKTSIVHHEVSQCEGDLWPDQSLCSTLRNEIHIIISAQQ